jgi:uncharacterized membrane protein YccF (DUF307 family)
MKTIGNLVWLIFGGIVIAVQYFIGSILLMLTIVGIPFGIQTMKMAALALWPFGRDTRVHSRASGCLYVLMNIIWLICGGLFIAVTHAVLGVILCITIIGIPFGMQHFKMTSIALTPFGRDIVTD